MSPQRCCGYTEAGVSYGCRFNPMSKGGKAVAQKNGQCMVCSPSLMEHMCSSGLLRGNLVYHLSRIRNLCPDVFQDALRRVPLEWQCVLARAVGDGGAKKQKKANKKAKQQALAAYSTPRHQVFLSEYGLSKREIADDDDLGIPQEVKALMQRGEVHINSVVKVKRRDGVTEVVMNITCEERVNLTQKEAKKRKEVPAKVA